MGSTHVSNLALLFIVSKLSFQQRPYIFFEMRFLHLGLEVTYHNLILVRVRHLVRCEAALSNLSAFGTKKCELVTCGSDYF